MSFPLVALIASFAGAGYGRLSSQISQSEVYEIPGTGGVDEALARMYSAVDPSSDRWVGEVATAALDKRLHDLGEALRHRDLPGLTSLLAPSFDGIALEPTVASSVEGPRGTTLLRHRRTQSFQGAPAGFASALLKWAADFETFAVVKFKIVGVEAPSVKEGADLTHTRILYEFSGRAADARFLSRRGYWRALWRSVDGTFFLAALSEERSESGSGRAPFFDDVSAAVLGDNDSYWRQMAKGIDYFRLTLDAASGIDLYGHSGVAIGDADGDSLEDLFVAQPQGLPNRLYRNLGDGTFMDVTREAGLDLLERTSMGLFADFDNDGDQDLLAVVQNAEPVLFVNDGRGRFQPSSKAGFHRRDQRRATLASASAADFDNDGLLDVYVCSYRFIEAPGEDTELARPYPYHDATNGPPNVLFRNRGDGSFEDVTSASGLDEGNYRFSFASAWGDYNQDGWLDLYVANDFGKNNLYQNLGGGRFREVTAEAGVEDVGAGMSVAW
ncbi:MAG: FG-GAP repeat domain-containing protein, partial [Vicinamibacteria bacterium]